MAVWRFFASSGLRCALDRRHEVARQVEDPGVPARDEGGRLAVVAPGEGVAVVDEDGGGAALRDVDAVLDGDLAGHLGGLGDVEDAVVEEGVERHLDGVARLELRDGRALLRGVHVLLDDEADPDVGGRLLARVGDLGRADGILVVVGAEDREDALDVDRDELEEAGLGRQARPGRARAGVAQAEGRAERRRRGRPCRGARASSRAERLGFELEAEAGARLDGARRASSCRGEAAVGEPSVEEAVEAELRRSGFSRARPREEEGLAQRTWHSDSLFGGQSAEGIARPEPEGEREGGLESVFGREVPAPDRGEDRLRREVSRDDRHRNRRSETQGPRRRWLHVVLCREGRCDE